MNPVIAFFDSAWKGLLGLDFAYTLTYVVLVVGGILLFNEFYQWLTRTLKARIAATESDLDDQLYAKFSGIKVSYFFAIIAWMVATIIAGGVGGESFASSILYRGLSIAVLVWTVAEVVKFVELILHWWQVRQVEHKKIESVDETKIGLWVLLIRIGLYITTFLVSLSIIGIKAENIWGAAGVGAIVLAFALQNVLADLFSSLSIYLDRPFRVGDMVNINGSKGSIKRIGLKTTRIQSLQGDEIIISNSQMLANQINNYRRMQKRRAEFSLTIDPKTSPKSMKQLQDVISKWLQRSGAEVVRNAFVGIEPGFYLCEIVYTLDDPDYERYVLLQEKLNYYILAQAKKLKVVLATNSLQNYTRRRTLS